MMKKLLLLLLGLGLMMGVGSAAEYTQTFGRSTNTLAVQSNLWDWQIISCSLPNCVFVQVQNNRYLSSTSDICRDAYILSSSWLVVATWTRLNDTGLVSFNFSMAQFVNYNLVWGSWVFPATVACNNRVDNQTSADYFYSTTWFFIDTPVYQWDWGGYHATRSISNWKIYQTITWSGSFYWPPTSTTIHYNWGTATTSSTNIYLQGQYRYSLSGSDPVFWFNPYRSILRRH